MPTTPDETANPLADCNDFPALMQLGRALWRVGGARGAALFVGAGLSRGALLSGADVPPPPLWSDLAVAMRAELYPANPDAAPWDPLRLAEEYRSYFGRSALDAFIRTHVRDIAWSPSPSHVSLLELPWSDVLTTNYDTLLERAGRVTERPYDPVRSESEIAFAKAPRIIKLHGSLGATDQFIISEEDFRMYPARHAAFVNLARQCFVENELCLLGFSGDDPNFLAWAGWVRDHLGSAARRIFLAGALDLSPAKRKYLEARNIAPIDVAEQVKDVDAQDRHAAATRLIIDALQALKPRPAYGWQPAPGRSLSSDADPAAKRAALDAAIANWREERSSYPGWLVCPSPRRHDLRFATELPRLAELEALAPTTAAGAISDWCWRHQIALWPIHPSHVAIVRKFADPATCTYLSPADRLLVAGVLLEHARRFDDDPLFSEMAAFIENVAPSGSDGRAALRYQQSLCALHAMDFDQAAALAEEIAGPDPAWHLRRGAVLASVGRIPEAEAAVTHALSDLRERERADRNSLWTRSRLAWAMFLQFCHHRMTGEQGSWPARFRESRCDPWQEIEAVTQSVVSEGRKRDSKPDRPTPNFEPGSFREPSRTIHFGDTRVEPCDELRLLLEQGGVPARLDYMTMFAGDRFEALELCHEATLSWYSALLANGLAKSDPQFERYFARVAIAALDPAVADGLTARLKKARDYWIKEQGRADQASRTFVRDRLLFVLELLARLAVRLDDARAIALHLETLQLAQLPQFHNARFAEPMEKLLASSFDAVAPTGRTTMMLPGLELPFAPNDGGPDPVNWLGGTRLHQARSNPALRTIVGQLLVEASGQWRRAAISRLTFLQFTGALTAAEAKRFARIAWDRLDDGEPPLPADTAVFLHFWAALPTTGRNAAAVVRARLFGPTSPLTKNHFGNMIRAVSASEVRPDPEQARDRFDSVAALRFKAVDRDDFTAIFNASLNRYDPLREAHFAGAALSRALAPWLATSDRTADRVEAIACFGAETGSTAANGALVEFIERHPSARTALETSIRRGLVAQDSQEASYAVDAMRMWSRKYPSGRHRLPDFLIDQLVAVVELRQSPALWRLLDGLADMSARGRVDESRFHRIDAALSDLWVETRYDAVDPGSERAGTVSLVRQEAVRLNADGHVSNNIQSWLGLAGADPLPEVRHATQIEADE